MQDINLYHLLKFYAKKWLWIVIFTIIGALGGFVYNTYLQVPLYKSDATLLLVSTEDRKIGQDSTLINNYIELLKSRRVLEPVISKQGHSLSYNELAASTTATNEKNTEVIKLSIASKDAELSKNLVEGVVISFKDEVKKLYKLDNINVVDNASKATQPYNIHTAILIALTTAAGFFTSVILLFFAYDLGIMKRSTDILQPTNEIKKATKPARQGGLVSKIVTMLVGAEVESTATNTQKPTVTTVINDQRHKPIVIVPPSEVKQSKSVKKSKRKK